MVERTGPTVSVIDDDASVRRALGRLFRSVGLGVETFATAEEFLAPAEGSRAACLIVDVRMPGMSGLELQKWLAARGQPIPIVFVTAHEDERARREAVAAGAVDFLLKPFDNRALLAAVAKALEQGNVGRVNG